MTCLERCMSHFCLSAKVQRMINSKSKGPSVGGFIVHPPASKSGAKTLDLHKFQRFRSKGDRFAQSSQHLRDVIAMLGGHPPIVSLLPPNRLKRLLRRLTGMTRVRKEFESAADRQSAWQRSLGQQHQGRLYDQRASSSDDADNRASNGRT
jgi:hypothetical protein